MYGSEVLLISNVADVVSEDVKLWISRTEGVQ